MCQPPVSRLPVVYRLAICTVDQAGRCLRSVAWDKQAVPQITWTPLGNEARLASRADGVACAGARELTAKQRSPMRFSVMTMMTMMIMKMKKEYREEKKQACK